MYVTTVNENVFGNKLQTITSNKKNKKKSLMKFKIGII